MAPRFGFVTVLVLSSVVIAATRQQPRDGGLPPSQASRSATGVVAGTVVADDQTARPIRMALVTVRSADGPQQYQTATDAEGRFVVAALAAGRYLVTVTKASYLPSAYGARSWSAPGTPIVLTDGERASVSLKLTKAASISGIVSNCAGYGVGGGAASAMRVQMVNGQRRFVATGVSMGYDERGHYRIYGLPPGEYIIQAGPTLTNAIDLLQTTDVELQWAQRQIQRSATGGGGTPEPAPRSANIAYPQCYYPGTPDESQAQFVKVAAGEDRTGVDFPGSTVHAATIQGTIVDPSGNPPAAYQAALLLPRSMFAVPSSVVLRPTADGKFSASRVPPGDYMLVARALPSGEAVQQGPSFAAPSFPGGTSYAPPWPLWAAVSLQVNGVDINNVNVQLQRGITIRGRIAFERRGTASPPAFSDVRVSLLSAAGNLSGALGAPPATVAPDGTFTILNVPGSSFRLGVAIPSAAASVWALKAATMSGQDAVDLPVEIRAGDDVNDALITLTDGATELGGRLVDSAGQPVQGYVLLAFSTESKYWLTGSRRVKITRSANDGTYKLMGLPAGDYYLAAAADVADSQIDDAALLETLAASALRLTLSDAEKKQLDFRLGN